MRLTDFEDPSGAGNRMSSRWGILLKLDIGRRVEGGKVVRCPFLSIQKGDFVDVIAHADIITFGRGRLTKHKVNFSFQQVVRLKERALIVSGITVVNVFANISLGKASNTTYWREGGCGREQ